ncbi:hypothetical protein AX15_003257 [Amanita polypyramis BW_CC]|nr:hypothetical protein AX15_003257 [Amanita polypyramis BW_CC]
MSSDRLSFTFNSFFDDAPSLAPHDSPTTLIGHPLKSAGLAPGDGDAGVTRPHLSRLTRDTASDSTLDSRSDDEDTGRQRGIEGHEREVIVHKVTPKDSLPGVSLKYGIPLAELRQLNQLWTSDSIHLRDVLYIPVEKAARTYSNSLADPAPQNTLSKAEIIHSSHNLDIPPSTTIQRIPASQLSFFPPTRTKLRRDRRCSLIDQATMPSKLVTLPRGFARTLSLQPAPLTSLLTALPIAASIRDDIVARLSFDSTTSSFDDRSKGQTDSEENHELEDVTATHNVILGLRFSSEDPPGEPTSLSNVNHESATPRIDILHDSVPGSDNAPRVLPAHLPSSYIPSSSSFSAVRTVQMEPSPLMQIPIRGNSVLHPRRGVMRHGEGKVGKRGSSEGMYSLTYDTVELQDTNMRSSGRGHNNRVYYSKMV